MKKIYALVLLMLVLVISVSCGSNKTIRFVVRSGVISTALTNKLVPKFNESGILKDNGLGDYEIKIEAISGSYDNLRSTIIYDIGSGNAPDIVIGYPDHFAEYISGGALVNLQTYIDDPKYGYTEEELADFVQSYLDENRGFVEAEDHKNDLFGLPFNKSTEVLIYNKTAFEVLFGKNYFDKVPSTWKQVREVGAEIIELVKAGKLDNTFVTGQNVDATGNTVNEYLKVSDYIDNEKSPFFPFGYDSTDNAFITLLYQFGGAYTERVRVNEGYTVFNTAENIGTTTSMLSYFAQMNRDKILATATTYNASYCSDALKLINCLMSIGSSAGVGYNSSDKYPYELGVAPIPYYDEGEGEPVKYVIQQGTNIAMLNQNTEEERLAAWLFVKFLLEPENTAEFAIETGGYLPVRQSAYETEQYKAFLENPTADRAIYSTVANAALQYTGNGYTFFVDTPFVGSAKIRTAVGDVFNEVVALGNDIQAAISKAENSLPAYQKRD